MNPYALPDGNVLAAKWFNHRRPVADLIDMVQRMGPGLFSDGAYLCQADDGECF